jgi:hypothetical protein
MLGMSETVYSPTPPENGTCITEPESGFYASLDDSIGVRMMAPPSSTILLNSACCGLRQHNADVFFWPASLVLFLFGQAAWTTNERLDHINHRNFGCRG